MYCSETLRACPQGDTKKVIENYFTHAVGYPSSDPIFYKDVTPTGVFSKPKILPSEGCPRTYIHQDKYLISGMFRKMKHP
ncbi:hypothetical protein [Sphingobacterium mizutaii]|uniref:hypothetical protein n=1 Tax=Sphingobacterium mizutaii TaxID=1010 RepID=UPI000B816E39|nr:hypothetical protein [Sphingobacterium mizutaii]